MGVFDEKSVYFRAASGKKEIKSMKYNSKQEIGYNLKKKYAGADENVVEEKEVAVLPLALGELVYRALFDQDAPWVHNRLNLSIKYNIL